MVLLCLELLHQAETTKPSQSFLASNLQEVLEVGLEVLVCVRGCVIRGEVHVERVWLNYCFRL